MKHVARLLALIPVLVVVFAAANVLTAEARGTAQVTELSCSALVVRGTSDKPYARLNVDNSDIPGGWTIGWANRIPVTNGAFQITVRFSAPVPSGTHLVVVVDDVGTDPRDWSRLAEIRLTTSCSSPAPTPGTAAIVYFRASPNPVAPTGTVTLTWLARGADHVEIRWLTRDWEAKLKKNQEYEVRRLLPLSGSLDVQLADVHQDSHSARFHLAAKNASGETLQDGKGYAWVKELTVRLATDMRIVAFTGTPETVQRGGTVTLTWDVTGEDKIAIERRGEAGHVIVGTMEWQMPVASNLPAKGSMQYKIPGDYIESIPLALVTFDRYGVRVDSTIIIKITCPFTSSLVSGCPVTQQQAQAAFQPFAGGFMFWRGDTREIYVLYQDRTTATYPDTWQEGEILNITETPPAGQVQPTRGFGKVWATQPGVREKLGWALAAETGYTTLLETHRGYLDRYPFNYPVFRLPDNRLVSMQDRGPTGLIYTIK